MTDIHRIKNQHQNDPLCFYIYAYIRSKDSATALAGTPYYIGKGRGKRAWKHNSKEKFKAPKDEFFIVILESDLSELGAFALERRMISWWGRKDLQTGILGNRTDGGEGATGYKQTEDHKRKIGISNTGKSRGVGAKNSMHGKTHTEEVKEILRQTMKASGNNQRKWFTDGSTNVYEFDCPCGFAPGRINPPHNRGKKYYNNGSINKMFDCEPDLSIWKSGMLPKKNHPRHSVP